MTNNCYNKKNLKNSSQVECFSLTGKGFGVKDVVEGMEYEFRVAAINNSGAGEFSTPSEFVFARDPKSRYKFRNKKVVVFEQLQ